MKEAFYTIFETHIIFRYENGQGSQPYDGILERFVEALNYLKSINPLKNRKNRIFVG